jgi:rRNA maturation endonuclease Nob1
MQWEFPPDTVYQVMTEQPDTCQRCGSRLMLLEMANIDDERVFVCECLECQRVIPVVEDEHG